MYCELWYFYFLTLASGCTGDAATFVWRLQKWHGGCVLPVLIILLIAKRGRKLFLAEITVLLLHRRAFAVRLVNHVCNSENIPIVQCDLHYKLYHFRIQQACTECTEISFDLEKSARVKSCTSTIIGGTYFTSVSTMRWRKGKRIRSLLINRC